MIETLTLALIPAWNEAVRVAPVVEATRAHLPVLVVDDGSHDETSAVAETAGATVVRHPQNQGKGAALMTGFTWALEHGYEAVITLDADGQHDPDEIHKFTTAYEAGAGDLIIGRRDFSQMPFPRNYTNRLFGSQLLSWALGARIYDSQSGYRLYGRRLLENLDMATTGFEWEVEVIVQVVCGRSQRSRGMRIGWVEIRTIYGVGEVSYFHPVKDSARFLAMVWRAWRRRNMRQDAGCMRQDAEGMMRETWVHASRTQQIQCRIGPAGRPEALLRDPGPRSILKVVTSRCGWGRRSHRPPGQVAGGAQVGQQARDEDGDGEAGKSPL